MNWATRSLACRSAHRAARPCWQGACRPGGRDRDAGRRAARAGGYAAAILLDTWALLGRPSLRAAEEALRRWMNAAALVRPGRDGGQVVLMADPAVSAVQALIRWDAATHAERELAERACCASRPRSA